ncbi:hypothetical protein NQZ79_g2586 [Umbelopsis isabellina]|nr:hypothetical protein NQZ79_g2586 [Umbelopsis isabellina]
MGSSQENRNGRTGSSGKRPRAPIACFRCHHKKVRCDGGHPNCARCLSTGVLCAFPSSRRSRNTQPANVDPFIDNLSQLEGRIRQIETAMEAQRNVIQQIVSGNDKNEKKDGNLSKLVMQMRKTEDEVQDSRSILAQLRLRGEQRISKNKRSQSPIKTTNFSKDSGPEDNNEDNRFKSQAAEESGSGNSEMPSMSSSPRASISSTSSCSSTPSHISSTTNYGVMTYGSPNAYSVHPTDNTMSMTPEMSFGQLGDQVSDMILGSQSSMFTSPSCGQYNAQDISSFMFAQGQQQNYSLPQQPSSNRMQDPELVAAVNALQNGQEVWYC